MRKEIDLTINKKDIDKAIRSFEEEYRYIFIMEMEGFNSCRALLYDRVDDIEAACRNFKKAIIQVG